MDVRALRAFAAVADEGHFTRAARRLHVAQPAVSKQVAKLEAEVGVQLLRRSSRGVEPTGAGELLLARARRILAELEAAEAELAEVRGLLRGRVLVGAMQSLGPVDLAGLLAVFHQRHPAVDLVVREEPTQVLERLVLDDALDLAFATARKETPGELERVPVADEDLVLVTAADHPLARRRGGVPVAATAAEPWVAFKAGTGLRTAFETATAAAGVEPRVAFESNELERVLSLVSRGLGISVVPRSSADATRAPLAVRDLRPRLRRTIVLLWRRDRRLAPAARVLLDLARTELTDAGRAATSR